MIGQYLQKLHQGIDPVQSMANKKGGSGGGQVKYNNLEKLYGTQAQAAQFMLDQSMPFLPGTIANSAGMAQEAMSGELGNRLRQQAGMDADAASGESLNAMNQNLSKYGINPNSGAFAGMASQMAVQNAANKVGAMNRAGQYAEDQKWNRNANFFGQLSGMGNGAMQGMSSAGSGLSSIANMQNNMDMAAASGAGRFGGTMANALFSAKDGGYVKMASGGDPWAAYKKQNPISTSGYSGTGTGGTIMNVLAGAAPYAAGHGLKAFAKSDMMAPVREGLSKVASGAKDAIKEAAERTTGTGSYAGVTTPGQAAVDTANSGFSASPNLAGGDLSKVANGVSEEVAKAASGGAEAAGTTANLVNPAVEAMASGAGETGLATLGTEAAGAAAGAEAAAAFNPVTLGLLAAGKFLDLFADGGAVQKDMRPGGKVTGPGTATSDSIPAMLSNGEYVLNAHAVKLAGKGNLEKLNQKGLAVRQGKTTHAKAKREVAGLSLAKGGAVRKGC